MEFAVLLSIGISLLLGGGTLLVQGASRVASGFGVSPMIVGLTVVAFGTSSPELVISIVGSIFIGGYALSQPNENSDDDDFGNGDGGMMQPVAATGAI